MEKAVQSQSFFFHLSSPFKQLYPELRFQWSFTKMKASIFRPFFYLRRVHRCPTGVVTGTMYFLLLFSLYVTTSRRLGFISAFPPIRFFATSRQFLPGLSFGPFWMRRRDFFPSPLFFPSCPFGLKDLTRFCPLSSIP